MISELEMFEIMSSDKWFDRCCTRMIRNGLHERHGFNLTTDQVRNKMRKLETLGKVKINKHWSSGSHITWEIIRC